MYTQTIENIKKLAEQGDAIVQNNLGEMYFNGRGVQQDHQESLAWFQLAAKQG